MKKVLLIVLITVFMLALATAAFAEPPVEAPPEIALCHYTGDEGVAATGEYILVFVPMNEWRAHLDHGDAYYDASAEGNCSPVEEPSEVVLSILSCVYYDEGNCQLESTPHSAIQSMARDIKS